MLKFIKYIITAKFLTAFCLLSTAQSISGKIIDSATSKPLIGASVYVGNSTAGSSTNTDGIYKLNNLQTGNYQLLISYVGYQTKQIDITGLSTNKSIDIALSPRSIVLSEVRVHAAGDWKRNLSLFKKDFIGTSDAQECKILNQDVLNLDFDYKNNRLNVSTDDFLDIENRTLGYKLRFFIKEFRADYTTQQCHYTGSVIFEKLHGKKSEERKWLKARQDVYIGSFRHFLISVSKGETDKDKYIIHKLARVPNHNRPADSVIRREIKLFSGQLGKRNNNHAADSLEKWRKLYSAKKIIDSLGKEQLQAADISKAVNHGLYTLQFANYLYIIYKNKTVTSDMDDLFRTNEARSHQIAAVHIKNPSQPLLFNSNGVLITRDNLYYEGAWNARIVTLLPDDYVPVK